MTTRMDMLDRMDKLLGEERGLLIALSQIRELTDDPNLTREEFKILVTAFNRIESKRVDIRKNQIEPLKHLLGW